MSRQPHQPPDDEQIDDRLTEDGEVKVGPGGVFSGPNALTEDEARARMNLRVSEAWGVKGHAKAREVLGPAREFDPFTYEPGAKLMAELTAAAADPSSDLDKIVSDHIEALK